MEKDELWVKEDTAISKPTVRFKFYSKQLLLLQPANDDKSCAETYIPINKIDFMRVYKATSLPIEQCNKYVLEISVNDSIFYEVFDGKNSAMFFVKKINRILDEYRH